VIPILGSIGIFDVRIMTRILTRVEKNLYSNSYPIRVSENCKNSVGFREPKLVNLFIDDDYKKTFKVLSDNRLMVEI
jgi:hypothetical protein